MEDCVLFLDFDGVLRPIPESGKYASASLAPTLGEFPWSDILSRILEPYMEVKILVSSDRRSSSDDETLVAMLGPLGWRFSGIVENYDELSRAEEIWSEVSRRGLTKWLAIDDHQSIVDASPLEPRFIVCEPSAGLSSESVQAELRMKLSLMLRPNGEPGGTNL